jgi:hypothetical protein
MKKQFFLNLMRGIAVVVFALTGFIPMQAGTVLAPFGQLSKQPWQAKYSNNSYNNWYMTDYDDSSWNDISGPISSTNDGLPYYATQWQGSYNRYYVRRHFNVNSLDQDIFVEACEKFEDLTGEHLDNDVDHDTFKSVVNQVISAKIEELKKQLG